MYLVCRRQILFAGGLRPCSCALQVLAVRCRMTEESAFEADPLHFALAVLRLVVAEELVVREAVYGQSLDGLPPLAVCTTAQ